MIVVFTILSHSKYLLFPPTFIAEMVSATSKDKALVQVLTDMLDSRW